MPYVSITGKLSIKDRKIAVEQYNENKIPVMLISKAGGVGLDLHETRAIIIMDIPWNPSSLEQAIGRVIRYKSHSNLPEYERYVDVYVLYCVKPASIKKKIFEGLRYLGLPVEIKRIPSVDIIMKGILERKEAKEKAFMSFLKTM